MVIFFWFSQIWPVTLWIQEHVFSGCIVPPDSKETWLECSDQNASPSVGKNTRVVLVPCCTWKCVAAAISSGVDISEVPGCHFLQQMHSQWGLQELLQGLMSPELTVYLSVFDLFLSSELWPYYQKDVNQTTLNHKILQNLALQIFVAFAWILLNVNLSLNETLLTYLLYTRQTWMTQLILANIFL